METWQYSGDQWNHLCPEKGHLVLTREQMNVYFVDKENRIGGLNATKGKWDYDDPPGCCFCGGLPVELAAVVQIVNKRREKYARRKTVD